MEHNRRRLVRVSERSEVSATNKNMRDGARTLHDYITITSVMPYAAIDHEHNRPSAQANESASRNVDI